MKPSLIKAIKEDPLSVVRILLEQCFWLPSIKSKDSYLRFEDDSREGTIEVSFTPDGDGWIEVLSKPDPNEVHWSFRFRMPMMGGGQSPRTRVALMILAEAIRLDNEKNPQCREPR